MYCIPDDPIIASMEATGYPEWMNENEDGYDDPFGVYDPD